MAIPTSNKPNEEKVDAAFEKKITAAIKVTKEQVGKAASEAAKTEELKIKTMWDVGKRLGEFYSKVPNSEKKQLVQRFHEEAGMRAVFYYLAMQFSELFNEADYKEAINNGLTVRVLKAIVPIKDDKLRSKLIIRAISEGLSADEIRALTGKKNARAAATGKRNRVNASKKSPNRVLAQANDRVKLMSEVLGFCSDAVGRLPECKTEDVRQEAIKELLILREGVDGLGEEFKSFLTFTKSFAKTTTK